VWEIYGRQDPQLGKIELKPGSNAVVPQDVRHGEYNVRVPLHESTFVLNNKSRYKVEVWGRVDSIITHRSAAFDLR
jgi:hypothetical protein